jgi:hypothetical protein
MQGRQDGRSQILAHSPVVVYEIDKLARHRNYFISCPFGVDSPGTLSAPLCGNASERRTIRPEQNAALDWNARKHLTRSSPPPSTAPGEGIAPPSAPAYAPWTSPAARSGSAPKTEDCLSKSTVPFSRACRASGTSSSSSV